MGEVDAGICGARGDELVAGGLAGADGGRCGKAIFGEVGADVWNCFGFGEGGAVGGEGEVVGVFEFWIEGV